MVNHGLGVLFGGRLSTEISGDVAAFTEDREDALSHSGSLLHHAVVVQHHGRRKHQSCGVGDTFTRDIGGCAVNRLKETALAVEVGAASQTEAADETCRQIGDDVSEEVGRDHHVKLCGALDHLHAGVVDDQVVELDV